jgi:tetratricopeptide (TPR) repeat protein
MPDFQRQIYVSGKVVLEDGGVPPEPILIERVCNGSPRPEGYTDSKGRFSFQLGQNNAMFADASTSSMGDRMGDALGGTPTGSSPFGSLNGTPNLMGCELRAQLAGFRSDTVQLYGKRALENPDVGTIVMHRLAKVEGYTFSATSGMAPKDAQKAYAKAIEAIKKQKWADAEASLVKATETYPKYAIAWYDLGRLYQSQSKVDDAKKAYQEALAADPKFVSPYENLTRLSAYEANWEQTQQMSEKAIRLNPYLSPDVYYYNAVANLQLKNMDAAESSAREALKMDTNHRIPKINHVLGIVLANKEDFQGAAENLKFYLKAVPDAKDGDTVRKQLADVERLLAAKNTEAK